MRIDRFFGIILALLVTWGAQANNVRIKNQAIPVEMNLGKDSLMVKFDIRWDNSWRVGENWDAVYAFLKYKRKNVNEKWYHLRIKEGGHSIVTSDSTLKLTYKVLKDTMGCVGLLIYRRAEGTGNVSAEVRLKIDINQGDLDYYDPSEYQDFIRGKYEISAMAIEMVYVPYGPYYVGDGRSDRTLCDPAKQPYYVESEEAQTLGMDSDGTLNYTDLPKAYPKGFSGFYCMKYEISQEQYVDFLNKISYTDQKKRVGNNLDNLAEGQFIFGNPNMPDHRNGIVLDARKGTGEPCVFANNLNIKNEFNMPDDGQTLACNFMTPEDLWAYADWVGLRPMSEMEYEKACRQRNPVSKPVDFQYAWNSQHITPVTTVSDDRTIHEKMDPGANVNTGGNVDGPVRCGAFAQAGNTSMEAAGATHWGVMEMTGNGAEICCNTERGRWMEGWIYGDGNLLSTPLVWKPTKLNFKDSLAICGGSHHWPVQPGCGYYGGWRRVHHVFHWETPYYDFYGEQIIIHVELVDTMYYNDLYYTDPYADYAYFFTDTTVMLPYFAWVDTLDAYGTRGGSYATDPRQYNLLTVSGRGRAAYFQEGKARDPECTFRLVRDVETDRIGVGDIVLPNGKDRDSVVTCAGGAYTIREAFAGTTPGALIYSWECDKGSGWEVLPGKTDKELVLDEVWNDDTAMIEVKFRRKTMAPAGEGYSNVVTVVIGGAPILWPDQSAVDECDGSGPMICEYNVTADSIRWVWNNKVLSVDYNTKRSLYYPKYAHFGNSGHYNPECQVYTSGCMQSLSGFVNVSVQEEPCPETVTGLDGQTYAVIRTRSCLCWMAEDLRDDVAGSPDVHMEAGAAMYDFDLLNLEPTSSNATGNASELCPPNFYVPTKVELETLIRDLNNDPETTAKFLRGGAGGFYDEAGGEWVNKVDYYWAGIFIGPHGESWTAESNFPVLHYNGGTFEVIDEVTVNVEGEDFILGTAGDVDGTFYFPVRCIKKRN